MDGQPSLDMTRRAFQGMAKLNLLLSGLGLVSLLLQNRRSGG